MADESVAWSVLEPGQARHVIIRLRRMTRMAHCRSAARREDGIAIEAEATLREAKVCPFLVPVVADRLRVYPVTAHCRTPDGRVRVPIGVAATCICMTPAHLLCPGYLASVGQPPRGKRPGAGCSSGR